MELLVGIMIGLILGLTGAGGSVVAVPLLMGVLNLPVSQAIGMSLGVVSVSALFGVLLRLNSRQIQWLPALVFAVMGCLIAPFGVWANQQVSEITLILSFTVLVVLVAGRLWVQASQHPTDAEIVRADYSSHRDSSSALCRVNQNNPFKIGLPCVLGVSGGATTTGFLSGLFGVGGGFLIVPTLIVLTGITIQQAIATSLVVIAAIGGSGFLSFLVTSNEFDFNVLSQLALGGLAGMLVGAICSRYLAGPMLQKLFVVVMVLLTSFMLITQLS